MSNHHLCIVMIRVDDTWIMSTRDAVEIRVTDTQHTWCPTVLNNCHCFQEGGFATTRNQMCMRTRHHKPAEQSGIVITFNEGNSCPARNAHHSYFVRY